MFNNRIKYRAARNGLVMIAPHPDTKEPQKLVIGPKTYAETFVLSMLVYVAAMASVFVGSWVLDYVEDRRDRKRIDEANEKNKKLYDKL